MDDLEPRQELADIAASVRALIEHHASIGADGLPSEASAGEVLGYLAADARRGRTAAAPRAPAAEPPRAPAPTRAHEPPAARSFTAPAEPPAARSFAAPAEPPAARSFTAPAEPPAARAPEAPRARAPETAPVDLDGVRARLAVLDAEARACTRCRLSERRTQAVFARGNPAAEVCFVGEGPGADEDAQGQPFVGRAGQLLDKMIAAMGYARDDVYVCNVVKCRPPDNRTPERDEVEACAPYLAEQLALVQPKVLVALGASATRALTGTNEGIMRLRGKWKLYKGQVPIMPTFHPAYLLRQPDAKRDVWTDLQEVMRLLGKPVKR
jgi:DNA polymerase